MRRRTSILVTLAVALAGTLLATPSPAVSDPPPVRSVRPRRRSDRRLDAGRLHRPRLRPVRRADPGRHGRVDQALPLPGRGDLHLRGLAGLPHPAQPLATWVSTQVARGWRLLPIALGPQASCLDRFPRYSDDFKIDPRSAGGYAALAAGRRRGRQERRGRRGAGHRRRATLWYDLEAFDLGNPVPRVRPGLHQRVGDPDQAAATSPASTPARAGHQDARRRPRSGPASSPSRTASGSRAGTASPTRPRATSPRTAGARAAG